jgi:type III secretion protein L
MAGQMVELTAKSIQKFSEFEEAILNIVMRSLRRIVGEIGHTELIKRIVSNALEVVRNQKKAILRVHPDQAPGARESVDDWVKQGNQMELLEVVADNRLEKNACIVETEIGVVDATLDVQLEAIHGILRKKFSGG